MAVGQIEGRAPEPADQFPRLLAFIKALRRTALALIFSLVATTLVFYFLSPRLFDLIQGHLHQKLVFFSVTEPFLAHVKLALGTALLVLVPLFVTCLWRALAIPFKLSWRSQLLFIVFTCLLFYTGALFCYAITLAYGIDFLLGFSSEQLQPLISIDKFVTFIAVFILGFGLIFELPIFMIFTAKVGLLPRQLFEKNRRYAILIISIVAAVLTPTPDVFNMMLMGLPLYALYEIGIIVLKIMRIR
jgi:sec-independent protein translocase protein TatC